LKVLELSPLDEGKVRERVMGVKEMSVYGVALATVVGGHVPSLVRGS
jgi:hypothetical protein